MIICTLLNGSTWSKEKKYMRRPQAVFDIFLRVEHRMKKEEVIDKEEGAIESIPDNDGRIVQVWVNVRGDIVVFPEYFWLSEDWIPRNEVLLDTKVKQMRTTKYSWLIACDANMCPREFEKSMWIQSIHMFIGTSAEVSHVQIKRPKMWADWENVWLRHCKSKPPGQDHENESCGRLRNKTTQDSFRCGRKR